MNEVDSLKSWLRQWFSSEGWEPCFVGVFGSAALNVPEPRDYDLLVVVPNSLENEYWFLINQRRIKLIRDAALVFRTPLSPTLLSLREINETSVFMQNVIGQPIINVLGDLAQWIEGQGDATTA